MNEQRNAYGYPINGGEEMSEESAAYVVPRFARDPHLIDPPEAWYADMEVTDATALLTVQSRVLRELGQYLPRRVCDWVTEEALFQLRTLLIKNGQVALPEIGSLEVCNGPDGRPAAVVFTPSDSLIARLKAHR